MARKILVAGVSDSWSHCTPTRKQKVMNTSVQLTAPFHSAHRMVSPAVMASLSTSIKLIGNPLQAYPEAYLLRDSRFKLTPSIKHHTDNMVFCKMGSISCLFVIIFRLFSAVDRFLLTLTTQLEWYIEGFSYKVLGNTLLGIIEIQLHHLWLNMVKLHLYIHMHVPSSSVIVLTNNLLGGPCNVISCVDNLHRLREITMV